MTNNAESSNVSNLIDFPRDKWKKGGSDGNDGGNGMDDLKKRVERTEDNIAQIKIDLSKLTTRAEEFSTKSDVLALKTDLKTEIASLRNEQKTETASLKSELQKELISVHKEITIQTKWISATMIAIAGTALAISKYLFG